MDFLGGYTWFVVLVIVGGGFFWLFERSSGRVRSVLAWIIVVAVFGIGGLLSIGGGLFRFGGAGIFR